AGTDAYRPFRSGDLGGLRTGTEDRECARDGDDCAAHQNLTATAVPISRRPGVRPRVTSGLRAFCHESPRAELPRSAPIAAPSNAPLTTNEHAASDTLPPQAPSQP